MRLSTAFTAVVALTSTAALAAPLSRRSLEQRIYARGDVLSSLTARDVTKILDARDMKNIQLKKRTPHPVQGPLPHPDTPPEHPTPVHAIQESRPMRDPGPGPGQAVEPPVPNSLSPMKPFDDGVNHENTGGQMVYTGPKLADPKDPPVATEDVKGKETLPPISELKLSKLPPSY
ncbi:hypothetical protein EIP91_009340 [Steccherinum ochraceum]|uniref:Uncharacterized protein n=1 Tax=Steccherinum ochraceum TaxID=92696 RepID=A0A4R0RJW5_9APHY|nr:hypothetical protein EIP91_009340 [Steccherinum ochraceum]